MAFLLQVYIYETISATTHDSVAVSTKALLLIPSAQLKLQLLAEQYPKKRTVNEGKLGRKID